MSRNDTECLVRGSWATSRLALFTHVMADPDTIERALGLILISRNIERIANRATNIAEEVIFVVEGKDVRHHHSAE